ncbi:MULTISPECIES: PH domain-containing protein [unclassified Saccharothrix]|uniref:PH domain-containing protein n=1 Tax=unclassified Saccharothrix TaxID=2593673 RepID=UPI00307E84E8
MAYPDDLLSPSEHVVLHKHPHWKTLVVPVLALVVVVAAAVALAVLTDWGQVAWLVVGVVAAAVVVWLTLVPVVRWRTTHFIVTSDRVMYREGVLKRTGLDIPHDRISSVRFQQSLPDRVLGCGTLIVESSSDEPLEFDDIPGVEKVHSLLYREINSNPDDDFQPGERVGDGRA